MIEEANPNTKRVDTFQIGRGPGVWFYVIQSVHYAACAGRWLDRNFYHRDAWQSESDKDDSHL
jgi:hypothetical protein